MMTMNKNRRRSLGLLVVGGAAAVACSVDTSNITFVDDDRFDMIVAGKVDMGTGDTATGDTGAGGAPDTGGTRSTGGGSNKAGTTSRAGTGTGGSTNTGGKTNGGSGGAPPGGTGGMGMGGMGPPKSCPVVKGDPTALLIDDLEDGDTVLPPMTGGRIGGWYVFNDGTGVQLPDPSLPPVSDKPGANGSAYAMHTGGQGFTIWGAGIGLGLLSFPGLKPCAYDVTPYKGVRFWLQGMVASMAVRFQIPTVETHQPAQGGTCTSSLCGDHYGFDVVPVPTTWTKIDVPFTALKQTGFGDKFPLNLQHAINIEFVVKGEAQFEYWVDNVQFY
jgi:hypothetical protein